MVNYFTQIHEDMNSRISHLDFHLKKANYYTNIIVIIESCIERLKHFLLANPFEHVQDEINYFKHQKPLIVSKLIFYKRLLFIEMERPFGSTESKIEHLENELKLLTIFGKEHSLFIHYIRSGKTDLDERYFVRENAKSFQMHDSFSCEIDYTIGTGHDYRLSSFLAYELLESHIQEQIDSLKNPSHNKIIETSSPYDSHLGIKKLKWTGSHSDLSELVYGLCYSKSINNGNVGIKELTAFFEREFNVKLNNVYRTFADIKKRKTIERFTYISSMINNLEQISDEDFNSFDNE